MDAMVVHVAYMATPFWIYSRDKRNYLHGQKRRYLSEEEYLENRVGTEDAAGRQQIKLSFFHSHQHTVEPQVHFVIFVEPGPIVVETVAGEEYHDVVRQGDQDEESQSSGHLPLIGMKVCFIAAINSAANQHNRKSKRFSLESNHIHTFLVWIAYFLKHEKHASQICLVGL